MPTGLDSQDMAASIRALPDQCREALAAVRTIPMPAAAHDATRICLAGMGGSALAAHVLGPLYREALKSPLSICSDYALPGWVGPETLVILSSYSGATAETLACAQPALDSGAMVCGITTGGPLLAFLEAHGSPVYRIVATHNPCGQPRMALGYGLIGVLGLLVQGGQLGVQFEEVERAIPSSPPAPLHADAWKGERALSEVEIGLLKGRHVVVIASEHLSGCAHVLANQLNENAKAQASYHLLPEVNHHLLEGLLNPPELRDKIAFLFLRSQRYRPENRARYGVMQRILDDLGIAWTEAQFDGGSALNEVLQAIIHGSWISYHLALAYGVDPSPIPYVDRFKAALKTAGF